jgi:fructose-1,6-bisphosphatase/inositol monophosphatase family enzyme
MSGRLLVARARRACLAPPLEIGVQSVWNNPGSQSGMVMIDSARALEVMANAVANAAFLAKSYQARARLISKPLETIERSDQELSNALAHSSVENRIQDEILTAIVCEYEALDVICEESSPLANALVNPWSRHTVLVDPIDFTRNYIEGGNRYAITAALCEKGIPIAAVVEFPARDERFLCRKGGGVRKVIEDRQEEVKAISAEATLVVANRRSIDRLKDSGLKEPYRLEPMQFTLEDILRCIRGEVAAVVCYRNKAYDIAPSALIAEEAGLIVCDWQMNVLRFDRRSLDRDSRLPDGCIVASTPAICEHVLTCFKV